MKRLQSAPQKKPGNRVFFVPSGILLFPTTRYGLWYEKIYYILREKSTGLPLLAAIPLLCHNGLCPKKKILPLASQLSLGILGPHPWMSARLGPLAYLHLKPCPRAAWGWIDRQLCAECPVATRKMTPQQAGPLFVQKH